MNMTSRRTISSLLLFTISVFSFAQQPSKAWNPDKGERYINPVLNADYSDPDVCRVGDDYYMTSSSFSSFPGLQILHSTDLVNWEIIGAALRDYPGPNWSDERQWQTLGNRAYSNVVSVPGADEWKTVPQHGNGVWAPAIRYHNGEFYIYCGDPDRGIFMVKTKDPRSYWDDPVWVVKARGFIDPCPLWDEDGKAYLSYGCAGSRAGHKSVMFVSPMSEDGTKLLAPGRIVYDGHRTQPTIEGTKFYKYKGYYYIFSPAGGVPTGWQVVLRSSSPWGPYTERVVMAQGESDINGPHQGAWVDTPSGEHWFLHFQDKDAYGRVVHLQPMTWTDENWPVIGVDKDGDGVGEPVAEYRKPDLKSSGVFQPADSDEFDSTELGLQWQWHGVPSPYWYFCDAATSALKLYSVEQSSEWKNLADSPNLLLQKFPADDFSVSTKLTFVPNPQLKEHNENAGLVIMGQDYFTLRISDSADGISLQAAECKNALKGKSENILASVPLQSIPVATPYSDRYMSTTVPPVAPVAYAETSVYLRCDIKAVKREGNVPAASCKFFYSLDGKKWTAFPSKNYIFNAEPGKWIGAKFGFYCNRHSSKNDSGWLQIDWTRVDKL